MAQLHLQSYHGNLAAISLIYLSTDGDANNVGHTIRPELWLGWDPGGPITPHEAFGPK